MKKVLSIVPFLTLSLIVATPLVVYPAGKKAKSEVVMKVGSKVHLFHSGKTSVQKDIAIGDTIPVYRMTPRSPQMKEVGQVKVLGYVGEHYFEAEIVKGDVKVGDIARKEKSGFLVQPVPAE